MPSTGFHETGTVKAWAEKIKQRKPDRKRWRPGSKTTGAEEEEFKEDQSAAEEAGTEPPKRGHRL